MMTNETLQIIKQRRSIRHYKNEQIREEVLQAVLEAGMHAPNAGDQAWHFTVVQNRELLERLNLAAKEAARQSGIQHLSELGSNEEFNCLYGAPTLIIVSGDQNTFVPLEADCAASTQNMLIAAESMGLGTCWIYFVQMAFSSSQGADLRRELKIPEDYKPYYSAVFGYKNEEAVDIPDRKPGCVTYIR